MLAARQVQPVARREHAVHLYDNDAQRRVATRLPDVRLVAILHDPVDRAYSNRMHLWADGLEGLADFSQACAGPDRGRLGAIAVEEGP